MIIAQTYLSGSEEKFVTIIKIAFESIKNGLSFQYLPDSIHIYPNYEKVLNKYSSNRSIRSDRKNVSNSIKANRLLNL